MSWLICAVDTKEGLYFGREVSADDPESSQPLTGPNQWPSEVAGHNISYDAFQSIS